MFLQVLTHARDLELLILCFNFDPSTSWKRSAKLMVCLFNSLQTNVLQVRLLFLHNFGPIQSSLHVTTYKYYNLPQTTQNKMGRIYRKTCIHLATCTKSTDLDLDFCLFVGLITTQAFSLVSPILCNPDLP